MLCGAAMCGSIRQSLFETDGLCLAEAGWFMAGRRESGKAAGLPWRVLTDAAVKQATEFGNEPHDGEAGFL